MSTSVNWFDVCENEISHSALKLILLHLPPELIVEELRQLLNFDIRLKEIICATETSWELRLL